MTQNRVIGREGTLPWRLPDELAYFREITLGKPVIMGRKTFDSIGRRPLPKRQNIVISRHAIDEKGIHHAHDLIEALSIAHRSGTDECMVVGGSRVYEDALPLADRLYQTIIHAELEGDVFLPEFDTTQWTETQCVHHAVDETHAYAFDMMVLERRRQRDADN